MAEVRISIVIVNYNVKDFLLKCLRSIYRSHCDFSYEVIVVDNDSTDGSVEELSVLFPQVQFIQTGKNIGFGRANNLGSQHCRGEYVLILNPDTILEEQTLEIMYEYMQQNSDVGIAGCKVLNADGSFQVACRRGFPTPWASFSKLFGLQSLFPRSKLFAKYNQTYKPIDDTYEVDAVIGAFMFTRKSVLDEVGGFDPDYFMYGEDIDLCYSVKSKGWKVMYMHRTSIIHYKGESTRRSSINDMKHFYNAMEIFAAKHYSNSKLFLLFLRFGIFLRFLISSIGSYKTDIAYLMTDLLILNASLLAGTLLRKGEVFAFPEYGYPIVFIISSLVVLLSNIITGVYFEKPASIRRFLSGLMISFFVLSVMMYFFQEYAFSRAVLMMMIGFTAVIGTLTRLIFKVYEQKYGKGRNRKVIVAGRGEKLTKMISDIQDTNPGNVTIIGAVITGKSDKMALNVPMLGYVEYLPELIKKHSPRDVILTDTTISKSNLMKIVTKSSRYSVRFHLADEVEDFVASEIINEITGHQSDLPQYNIDLFRYKFIKRLIDIIASFLLLTAFLPLIIIFKSNASESVNRIWDVFTGVKSIFGILPTDDPTEKGKPGLLGLAHLSSPEDLSEKAVRRLNEYYLRDYSISMDIDIMLKYLIKVIS